MMAIITDAQRKAIQKKIDTCIKTGLSKNKDMINRMAEENLYKVRDKLLERLHAYAPPFLDVRFYKNTYTGVDRDIKKPVMPSASVGKSGVIKLSLHLNLIPDTRESFGSYWNINAAPYVNLIQLFNNGVDIKKNTPYGEWHGRWIHASQEPTWRFRSSEHFIQRALDDIQPYAESLGVRIKYSRAFDDGAGAYLDMDENPNKFGEHYAW